MTNPKDPCGNSDHAGRPCHCCPDSSWHQQLAMSRRGFLTTAAVGGAVLGGLSWTSLARGAEGELPMPPARVPLKVFPVLVWDQPQKAPMTSWRGWGGIHTPEQAAEEIGRIENELAAIKSADFPVEFAKVASVHRAVDVAQSAELKAADVVIVYGAGGDIDGCKDYGKDVIVFQRHRSGPVYLQYEIVSPRFLRQHTDKLALKHIVFDDVVTDDQEGLKWRLRALCGLKNTRGTKILCIGGAAAWAQPADVVPTLVKKIWNMDLVTVSYEPELDKVIGEARADAKAVALAKQRAEAYLALPDTKLETKREFVDNCFLLDQVFRRIMAEANCRAITINGCMSTIMPKALTSACLTLSTLNDDGYLAFCESDFVVIPSGILLANISNLPVFLNDPTYPHDGVITLAHCTGPRKMNGKSLDPVRLVTHFESDYGAAPKVEMPKGQVVTNIAPDFKSECWMGLLGKIADAPFLPICRDQIDVAYDVPDRVVAERMPGFHWMTSYGDYMKELGYALRRVNIRWDNLNAPAV